MIKVENVSTWGLDHAIRGMRNPMNSWDRSDSFKVDVHRENEYQGSFYHVGESDLKLMQNLYKAGTEHRKFMRQIFVSMDITCNHFWWQEFDTYKIGVTRNSCSKMHKIHVKSFEPDDFSHEGIDAVGGHVKEHFEKTMETLEWLRVAFNTTHEKIYWRAMLELLPMGYNIKATITMSYENAANIINQRENHKVTEWNELIDILKEYLPYLPEIMSGGCK